MDIYHIAIEEYELEDDNGKHKLIYSYFGLAIYFAQCLEETFSNMIIIHRIVNNNIKTNNEINEIVDSIENSKKTMGNFIHEVKQVYNLTEELENSLIESLNTRNYIVHKYFKLHIEKFSSDIGKREMLNYFCNFISTVKKIDKDLERYYQIYMQKLNMTEELLNQIMNEMNDLEILRDQE